MTNSLTLWSFQCSCLFCFALRSAFEAVPFIRNVLYITILTFVCQHLFSFFLFYLRNHFLWCASIYCCFCSFIYSSIHDVVVYADWLYAFLRDSYIRIPNPRLFVNSFLFFFLFFFLFLFFFHILLCWKAACEKQSVKSRLLNMKQIFGSLPCMRVFFQRSLEVFVSNAFLSSLLFQRLSFPSGLTELYYA